MEIQKFIKLALEEDIQNGDFSTLASIPEKAEGKAILKLKQEGILAGLQWAKDIIHFVEPEAQFSVFMKDGDKINYGDIAFEVNAKVHTILMTERLLLNTMQRMSGIATLTNKYVEKIKNYNTKILDTRKTTPLFRMHEKQAVSIGGGHNHRFGLYDMIMLKDNHIDFCGGIEKAILKTQQYLKDKNLDLQIEVETRNIEDVKKVMATGGVDRIMLDNYSPDEIVDALKLINHTIETEASGGINFENIESYASTGVDYISVGALIHQAKSLDISLKAQI
ncbi:MAG TPA: carboxylating nicotinate-nucleotide diphosphorylase [Edaphocola sp.]|nr:carboxylating nicotinate-nucleotide diphosphorylase [Edaphocola sp.]